jgi:hypothetical protein
MKNTTISDLQGMALQATQAASEGRNTQALKLIRAYLQARSRVARNGVNTSNLNVVTRSLVRLASQLNSCASYGVLSVTCEDIQFSLSY